MTTGSWLRPGLYLVAYCVVYFLAARLGIAVAMPPEGIVILWPANAFVLAVLLAVERNRWWHFFLATLATEIAADVPAYPLWAAAAYGIVNFAEAALAAMLLKRFSRNEVLIDSPAGFFRFLAIGPVFAAGMAALGGALIYKIGSPGISYFHYWRIFWMGDATGLLIVGTALVAWQRPVLPVRRRGFRWWLEAALLAVILLLVSAWAFLTDASANRVYLVFPCLVWAALRFGVRAAAIAMMAVAATAIASALNGYGPFADLSNVDEVPALQGLIAVIASSVFIIAFTTEASRRINADLTDANRELGRINRELDEIVATKTSALRGLLAHNETLLKEVYHRVKNNLQIVSSIIAVHSRGIEAPDQQRVFSEVQKQIGAIAVAYDMLHRTENMEIADFSMIVTELCRNIETASGGLARVAAKAERGAWVSGDIAAVLSLALNELITNSIKHAPANEAAAVEVGCRRNGGEVVITVVDNGPGFPPDFDFDRAKGFGMRMMRKIIDQVDGTIRIVGMTGGAAVAISVPAAERPHGH